MRAWPAAAALGVVGASGSLLLLRRFVSADTSTALMLAPGAIPVAFTLAVSALMFQRVWSWRALGKVKANMVFTLLGVTTFASVVSLGFLLFKSGEIRRAMGAAAPLVCLQSAAPLFAGLLLWQRMTAMRLVAWRTAATSVAIVGAVAMLGGVTLAWPDAANLLPVLLLNVAMFLGAALLLRMAWAHLPAGVCLAAGYLICFHLGGGRIDWHGSAAQMAAAFVAPTSGPALVPLVAALTVAAALMARYSRTLDARLYMLLTASVAILSLGLVTWHGFGRHLDHGAAIIFALYAAAVSVPAWRAQRTSLSWLAGALWLIAIVQCFAYRLALPWGLVERWQVSLLIYATVMSGITVAGRLWARDRHHVLRPAGSLALAASMLCALLVMTNLSFDQAAAQSMRTFWLGGVWLVLCLVRDRPRPVLFAGCQTALTLSVLLVVTAWLHDESWFEHGRGWLHPWSLAAYFTALSLASLLWIVVRLIFRSELIRTPRLTLDRIVTGAVLFGLTGLVTVGILPGVLAEFAPNVAAGTGVHDVFGPSTVKALGPGSWCAAATLLTVFVAGLWERFSAARLVGITLLAAVAATLVAGQWHNWGAAASAWRWCLASSLVIVSIPIWWRHRLAHLVAPLRWPVLGATGYRVGQQVRAALLFTTLAPITLLTVYPMIAALVGATLVGPNGACFFGRVGPTVSSVVPLALAAAALVGHAVRQRSAPYAFGAGLFLNLAATLGWLMSAVPPGEPIGSVELIHLAQVNAIATAAFSLAWIACRSWLGRNGADTIRATQPSDVLLKLQIAIALVLNVILIVPATYRLIGQPSDPILEMVTVGRAPGWLGLALSLGCFFWLRVHRRQPLNEGDFAAAGVLVGAMVALSVCAIAPQRWVGYHTLLAAQCGVAWLILAAMTWLGRQRSQTAPLGAWRWPARIAALVVLLAVRGCFGDPAAPWWTVASLVMMAVLFAFMARSQRDGRHLRGTGLLLGLAASIWWCTDMWPARGQVPGAWVDLVHVNLIALTATGVLSVWMTLATRRHHVEWNANPKIHHTAALCSTAGLALTVLCGLLSDAAGAPLAITSLLPWLVVVVSAILLVLCLLHAAAPYGLPALFVLGLITMGAFLDGFDLEAHWLGWHGGAMLSFYALTAVCLWRIRDRFAPMTARLGLPPSATPSTSWLHWSVLAICATVTVLSYRTLFIFDGALIEGTATTALL